MSFSWNDVLQWMRDNQVGDITGVIGLLVSVGTIVSAFRAKTAAERAEIAAKETKKSISLFETVSDFTSAMHIIDDIKRMHRAENWILLPERYSTMRKILIPILSREQLTVEQTQTIEVAISNLSKMELSIERALSVNGRIKASSFRPIILKDSDNLLKVLSELKSTRVGA